jgi:processive 1,2-diacylglycerol beta-glucosyltransferase
MAADRVAERRIANREIAKSRNRESRGAESEKRMTLPMHAPLSQIAGNGALHYSRNLPSQAPRPHSPRVLVLSVSAGSGHLRAAEAVELALRRIVPEATVKNVDVLSLSIRAFRYCYGQVYVDLIDTAPQVLGFFYNIMDRFQPPAQHSHRWDNLRVSLEKMSMRPFLHLLQSEPWDLVINTHFLSGEIIASLYGEKRCAIPQVTVITDFEAHRLWVTQPCAHYFAATEEIARYLQCYEVPARDISVTGIPIHPVFAEPKSAADCRARHGLATDRPVILQLAGGSGVGPIEELYRSLLAVEVPIQAVVVTGHNTAARQRLEEVPVPPPHRAKIIGFTKEIDELMAAADLAVTKSGGLTISEAMARGLPLAIVYPVPGQEDRNSDYLLENGAAVKINHVPTLAFKITELLRDPSRLARLKASARRLGHPRSAFAVAEQSIAFLRPAALRQGQ